MSDSPSYRSMATADTASGGKTPPVGSQPQVRARRLEQILHHGESSVVLPAASAVAASGVAGISDHDDQLSEKGTLPAFFVKSGLPVPAGAPGVSGEATVVSTGSSDHSSALATNPIVVALRNSTAPTANPAPALSGSAPETSAGKKGGARNAPAPAANSIYAYPSVLGGFGGMPMMPPPPAGAWPGMPYGMPVATDASPIAGPPGMPHPSTLVAASGAPSAVPGGLNPAMMGAMNPQMFQQQIHNMQAVYAQALANMTAQAVAAAQGHIPGMEAADAAARGATDRRSRKRKAGNRSSKGSDAGHGKGRSAKRKRRTRATEAERNYLRSVFDQSRWPSKEVYAKIAKTINWTESSVRIWFQNERRSTKKAWLKEHPGEPLPPELRAPRGPRGFP